MCKKNRYLFLFLENKSRFGVSKLNNKESFKTAMCEIEQSFSKNSSLVSKSNTTSVITTDKIVSLNELVDLGELSSACSSPFLNSP